MVIYPTQPQQPINGLPAQADRIAPSANVNHKINERSELLYEQNTPTNLTEKVTQNGIKQNVESELNVDALNVKDETTSAKAAVPKAEEPTASSRPVNRSWADIVTEDKMSFALGKHLYEVKLDFHPVLLQPRGLINRRNWCYINACLQALLACSPFYTLLRDLPLGPGVDRGKSSTPVIDSMVKVMYEFSRYDTSQEELQLGPPFQPDFMYDMLSDLKSDCLKGQQEDAEEFLSFILNGMHEEMVKIIKNYQKKTNIKMEEVNGDIGDEGDEWQVIQVGSKNKGMVTRKVVEHRTPISDLLGGQIKSFLTTKTVKTASIQPFFTLQLDIQSDNVTSVSEALKEMTVKVPIQGYVCAKSKQEVEAFNHVALQKLPPILILHLKRFVYNKNGGCKKVMKKTDYPLVLDISKDILSSDVKNENLRPYKLFAVMYHDGEEAIKGHYISDVYNHGSKTWIRCDDRSVTAVTEDQVLSYSPPRVPYLLFYQES
ncbi:Ubiquitin carboxyl-terminal hydrolase 10 like protein [Argiope bruennichi]|uniref:ubiquitinyl hydrolase 1 n=1 Tax=Argiope bruennichi TaxID=94029 RepID=A0A8T0EC75_ARGBR|nr:Ubiquitin carboxyl-terminal hydrolase 10 like protein [Argiope bruennichi]